MAENPRANYAEVPGTLCGSPQESSGKRRTLPVQEHLPAGMTFELLFFFLFVASMVCQLIRSKSN